MKSLNKDRKRAKSRLSQGGSCDPSACTIISASQLASARVLASSYLKHHPTARFYALVLDKLPSGTQAGPEIRLIDPLELNLSYAREFFFMYEAGDLCAALKPALLRLLLDRYGEKQVIHFDSEVLITSRLKQLVAQLTTSSIVFPPHLGDSIPAELLPAEREVLAYRAYRPGFVAVRKSPETTQFLRWWEAWLHDKSRLDVPDALVTDGRWLDLVNLLFPVSVLRDPAYQVPYWQTHSPVDSAKGGCFSVNGRPLALFHFGKFERLPDSGGTPSGPVLAKLLDCYSELQRQNGLETAQDWPYGYSAFNNGAVISRPIRKLYAELDPLQRAAFGNPFECGERSFFSWATTRSSENGLSPFLKSVYKLRPDVAGEFPDVDGRDREAFLFWAYNKGSLELTYDPEAMKVYSGDAGMRRELLGDVFDNGVAISAPIRKLYFSLTDGQRAGFGDPIQTKEENSFFAWATRGGVANELSPFLKTVYSIRPDVMARFPDVEGRDRRAFLEWASADGAAELHYDARAMNVHIDKPERAWEGVVPRCSIIIPVYNKRSLTRNCLDSIFKAAIRTDFEIIVVDDASTDGTPQMLEAYGARVRTVRHALNSGFAASCNDGAAVARGEFLVFLNNDTIAKPEWLEALVQYADTHPQAAILGCKLLFPNETIQHAGMVVCQDREPRHIYEGFPADHPAVNKSRRMQIVTGACLFVRREDFDRAKGFDLGFRNGYEDVDLCLRVGAVGREVHYCHESVLYHLEAVSRDIKADEGPNQQLYRRRWAERIHPDEFDYYVEDRLLDIDYQPLYPMGLSISPMLAVSNTPGGQGQIERVLQSRSRQVFSLLKDNIRLSVRAQEAELHSGKGLPGKHQPSDPKPLVVPEVLNKGHIHRWAKRSTSRLISIILPVKNGAARLRGLLPAILSQTTDDPVEIIAVDSGSTDESIDLLRNAHATVIGIQPQFFNHGLTRNLATSYASGSIFVFVNQSTMPADEHWLANLTAPFLRDGALAGVCSRILARKDADLLAARDIARNINASPERVVTAITDWNHYRALKKEELRRFVNFHTLSAAIRSEVFRQIPFRDVRFAEDLMWGKEALECGFRIQFEPASVAFHSHNYSMLEIFRRNFDDGIAGHEIVNRTLAAREVRTSILHQVREDWRYLEQECVLGPAELEEWRLEAAMRRTAQWIGQWIGINSGGTEEDLRAFLSGVEQVKAGAKSEMEEAKVRSASTAG